MVTKRHCWVRLRHHKWVATGALRLGSPFNRGTVLRCAECSHETATVNRELIHEAYDNALEIAKEYEHNQHPYHIDDPEHFDEQGRYKYWGE